MRKITPPDLRTPVSSIYLLVFVVIALFTACKNENQSATDSDEKANETKVQVSEEKKNKPIKVLTKAMDFNMPDEIPSGWNTFRYENRSNEIHFFIFEKLPDSITIKEYKEELIPPFKKAFGLMNEGKTEEGMKAYEKIPAWFFKVVFSGGSGLLSPKRTSETTINLEPGLYAMECYIRMPDGTPHVFMGMLKEIKVTEKQSKQDAPEADLNISISGTEGIKFDREKVSAGSYTFGVTFEDQKLYENFVGHDVNLVKMEEGKDVKVLADWIDSANIKAFRTPAPEGFEFLGGSQEAPAGTTTYFTANLKPGQYVLISETPKAIERNMLKTFVVSN
ncbi:hypothetical protein [Christiangramia aquimixticola]|uniref:hypothetical protein n=1 Tax=Christiangramia aquimixticola TaxID=1697558 RepID=UPI003AA8425F